MSNDHPGRHSIDRVLFALRRKRGIELSIRELAREAGVAESVAGRVGSYWRRFPDRQPLGFRWREKPREGHGGNAVEFLYWMAPLDQIRVSRLPPMSRSA